MGRSGKVSKKNEKVVDLKSNTQHAIVWVIGAAIGVLFLLQSYREFVSSVYFYSLVGLGASPVTAFLALFLAPLLTGVIVKKLGPKNSFLIAGAVMISARLPMSMGLESPYHMIFSGITYASSAIFLSIVIALHRRERQVDPDVFSSQALAASFGIALLILLAMSTIGRGVDPSIIPNVTGMVLAPALAGIFCGVGAISLYLLRDAEVLYDVRGGVGVIDSKITGGAADSWAPGLGLAGFLFFATAIVTNPSVTVGWLSQNTNFQLVTSMSIVSIALFLLSLLSSSGYLLSLRRSLGHPKGALIGNIIFLIGGVNLFFFHFPLPTAPAGMIAVGMVNIWLIIDALTDSKPFAGESFQLKSSEGEKIIGFPHKSKNRSFPGHFGKLMTMGLGVSTLIFVFITLSLNWSFIPMGAILEGSIPTIMVGGLLLFALTGFSCSKSRIYEPAIKMQEQGPNLDQGSPTIDAGKGTGHLRGSGEVSTRLRGQWIAVGAITIVLILLTGLLSVTIYSGNIDERSVVAGETIRVATYNVHHGYANDGRVDPSVQLDILQDIDADIVFLQESDSLRFTEGNFDPAFYYASRLDMYLFRGPNPGTGTPGVAILSRFKMEDPEVHFLETEDIARIAISCKVTIAGRDVRIVGLHMGLEETERDAQLEQLEGMFLEYSGQYDGVIVGGDFNTEPEEPMMARMNPIIFGNPAQLQNASSNVTGLRLQSAWHSVEEEGRNGPIDLNTYPSIDVEDELAHIDYILFNDMFQVEKAVILEGRGASDHKPVWGDLVVLQ